MKIDIATSPWKLVRNKVKRYPGGREIDRFRGIVPSVDDGRPEAWVGSDTSAGPERKGAKSYEGHARCVLPDDREMYVCEALKLDPYNILGAEHVSRYGIRLGILVKLLDAQTELILQAHPTREFAQDAYNSDFGKEESWYVISLRDDASEPPYVYIGFKEDITRKIFEEYYDAEDIEGMKNCVHKVPVENGDMVFVPAGVPHAVGEGCLVVEVQEPSDITASIIKFERLREIFKEIGAITEKEKMEYDRRQLDTFIYDGCSYEENYKKYFIQPAIFRSGNWGKESLLLGMPHTDYFSISRIDAKGPAAIRSTGYAHVAIVLEGDGRLVWEGGEMGVKKADELLFPAKVKQMRIIPGNNGFSAVLCHPTGVRFD